MAFELDDFRRVLMAVLHDPARADLLVDAVAQVAATGEETLQRAVAEELERAIKHATEAPAPPGRPMTGRTRIDVLMLSPGGVVLKGRTHGKSVLADLLKCTIDEGRAFGALSTEPFASQFALVRDGKSSTQWFDFAQGQAGFAAIHSGLGEAPLDKPGCIFGIFITPDRAEETRRDPSPTIMPMGLGEVLRRTDPAKAKAPRDWITATPDRRIIRLRDGRAISTRWYGSTGATPVLVFGAIHKSTMADAFLANAAIQHGLALLVIERPGIGASDPSPVTSYEAVAEDAAEICSSLGLSRVLVYGAGSAASFALATAHRLGAAAKAVALAAPRVGRPSAEAPSAYGRVLWALLKNPFGLDVLARLLRQFRIAGSVQSLMMSFSVTNERDQNILQEMGVLAYAAAQTNDAVHKTVAGALAEFRLYRSGARFDPARVHQPIRIWQGADDKTLLGQDTIRAFASAPNVHIQIVPGAGVLMDPAEAASIVRWLAEGWKTQIANVGLEAR